MKGPRKIYIKTAGTGDFSMFWLEVPKKRQSTGMMFINSMTEFGTKMLESLDEVKAALDNRL